MKSILALLISAHVAFSATTNWLSTVMADSSGIIARPSNFMAANGIVSNALPSNYTNHLASTTALATAIAPLAGTNNPNGKTITINGRLDFGSTGGLRFPTNADQLVTYGPYLTIGDIGFPESSTIPWEIAVFDGPNDESYHFAYREHLVDIRDNLTNQMSQGFIAASNFSYTAITERCFASNNIPYYATYSGGTYTSGILEEGSLYYYKPGTGTGEGGSISETPSGQTVNPNAFFLGSGKSFILAGSGNNAVTAQVLKYPFMYGGTNLIELQKLSARIGTNSNLIASNTAQINANSNSILVLQNVTNSLATTNQSYFYVTNEIAKMSTNTALSSPQWIDLPLSYYRLASTPNNPTFTSISGSDSGYDGFDVGNYAYGAAQFPHNVAVTNSTFTNFYFSPHIHLTTPTNSGAAKSNVAFQLSWSYAPIGSTRTIYGTNYALFTFMDAATNAGYHSVFEFPDVTNNVQNAMSASYRFKLTRITTNNEVAGPVCVMFFDIHVPVGNKTLLGSRQEYTQ